MIEESSLFHDNNRNRITILFLKYIHENSYKYRTILRGVFPLLLYVCDNGYVECKSFCDPCLIEEKLFETVMLNFGAYDTCLVPIEINCCTSKGFEKMLYSSFLSINIMNRTIELIMLEPDYPINRLTVINKYLSHVFNKQCQGRLFYVGINKTTDSVIYYKNLMTFSGLCFYYKTTYNTICPLSEIAKELSHQLTLINLKFIHNNTVKEINDDDRGEGVGDNREVS